MKLRENEISVSGAVSLTKHYAFVAMRKHFFTKQVRLEESLSFQLFYFQFTSVILRLVKRIVTAQFTRIRGRCSAGTRTHVHACSIDHDIVSCDAL